MVKPMVTIMVNIRIRVGFKSGFNLGVRITVNPVLNTGLSYGLNTTTHCLVPCPVPDRVLRGVPSGTLRRTLRLALRRVLQCNRTGSSFPRRCFSSALLSPRLRSGQALRLRSDGSQLTAYSLRPSDSEPSAVSRKPMTDAGCRGHRAKDKGRSTEDRANRESIKGEVELHTCALSTCSVLCPCHFVLCRGATGRDLRPQKPGPRGPRNSPESSRPVCSDSFDSWPARTPSFLH